MVVIEETYELRGAFYKRIPGGKLVEQTFEHNGAFYKILSNKTWYHLRLVASVDRSVPTWVKICVEDVPKEVLNESSM